MARKGQSAQGQDQDDSVFLPLQSARQRVIGTSRAKNRSVGSMLVKVREGENMAEAEAEIKSLLRQRHRLREGDDDDFTLRNLTDILSTVEASARVLSLGLSAVAAVSLLVGGIGIMNIMLVSVTERTREIGVRMAVGARPRDVMGQFLIEATTLALIGGVAGILLGGALSQLVSHLAGWPLYVDISAIVMAVAVSGLIGILSGFYPAWRASRLDPVEALRSA
jgi:putative ABC transport system permease protein